MHFNEAIVWSPTNLKDAYLEDFLWRRIQHNNFSFSKTSLRHLQDVLKDTFKMSSRPCERQYFFSFFNVFFLSLCMQRVLFYALGGWRLSGDFFYICKENTLSHFNKSLSTTFTSYQDFSLKELLWIFLESAV